MLLGLSRGETSTAQVIIGLISRAYEAGQKAGHCMDTRLATTAHLWPCGCLINDGDAHRVGCPEHPQGQRGYR